MPDDKEQHVEPNEEVSLGRLDLEFLHSEHSFPWKYNFGDMTPHRNNQKNPRPTFVQEVLDNPIFLSACFSAIKRQIKTFAFDPENNTFNLQVTLGLCSIFDSYMLSFGKKLKLIQGMPKSSSSHLLRSSIYEASSPNLGNYNSSPNSSAAQKHSWLWVKESNLKVLPILAADILSLHVTNTIRSRFSPLFRASKRGKIYIDSMSRLELENITDQLLMNFSRDSESTVKVKQDITVYLFHVYSVIWSFFEILGSTNGSRDDESASMVVFNESLLQLYIFKHLIGEDTELMESASLSTLVVQMIQIVCSENSYMTNILGAILGDRSPSLELTDLEPKVIFPSPEILAAKYNPASLLLLYEYGNEAEHYKLRVNDWSGLSDKERYMTFIVMVDFLDGQGLLEHFRLNIPPSVSISDEIDLKKNHPNPQYVLALFYIMMREFFHAVPAAANGGGNNNNNNNNNNKEESVVQTARLNHNNGILLSETDQTIREFQEKYRLILPLEEIAQKRYYLSLPHVVDESEVLAAAAAEEDDDEKGEGNERNIRFDNEFVNEVDQDLDQDEESDDFLFFSNNSREGKESILLDGDRYLSYDSNGMGDDTISQSMAECLGLILLWSTTKGVLAPYSANDCVSTFWKNTDELQLHSEEMDQRKGGDLIKETCSYTPLETFYVLASDPFLTSVKRRETLSTNGVYIALAEKLYSMCSLYKKTVLNLVVKILLPDGDGESLVDYEPSQLLFLISLVAAIAVRGPPEREQFQGLSDLIYPNAEKQNSYLSSQSDLQMISPVDPIELRTLFNRYWEEMVYSGDIEPLYTQRPNLFCQDYGITILNTNDMSSKILTLSPIRTSEVEAKNSDYLMHELLFNVEYYVDINYGFIVFEKKSKRQRKGSKLQRGYKTKPIRRFSFQSQEKQDGEARIQVLLEESHPKAQEAQEARRGDRGKMGPKFRRYVKNGGWNKIAQNSLVFTKEKNSGTLGDGETVFSSWLKPSKCVCEGQIYTHLWEYVDFFESINTRHSAERCACLIRCSESSFYIVDCTIPPLSSPDDYDGNEGFLETFYSFTPQIEEEGLDVGDDKPLIFHILESAFLTESFEIGLILDRPSLALGDKAKTQLLSSRMIKTPKLYLESLKADEIAWASGESEQQRALEMLYQIASHYSLLICETSGRIVSKVRREKKSSFLDFFTAPSSKYGTSDSGLATTTKGSSSSSTGSRIVERGRKFRERGVEFTPILGNFLYESKEDFVDVTEEDIPCVMKSVPFSKNIALLQQSHNSVFFINGLRLPGVNFLIVVPRKTTFIS